MPARLVSLDHDGRAALGLAVDEAPDLLPIVVDLATPRSLARTDDLVRALGLGRGVVTVIDATAGLGRDALALASVGFSVTAVERSPLVQALWQDAIARTGLPERLRFVAADAAEFLRSVAGTAQAPDAVFLDPMYPHGPRRAMPQKEMRLLRAAVGDDVDAADLFAAARAAARRRVVVKRPKRAPPMGEGAAHCWTGASTRLELYLTSPSSP
ncbi:MAG: rRNA methyltransferase [Deltaproteobacteria bacterium]|nr:rRNA methyltransferase [Deltaproteobacteria bacterium]